MCKRHSILIGSFLLFAIVSVVFLLASPQKKETEPTVIFAEQWGGFERTFIEHMMQADNNHRWRSAYDVEAKNQRVTVYIGIKVIPVKGADRVLVEKKKNIQWLNGIEQKWNNRLKLKFADGSTWPIYIQPYFTVVNPHHEVIVRENGGRPNQNNWYETTSGPVVAHEVGHMLGAYDEYHLGALDLATGLVDQYSLMGVNPEAGQVHPRHLERMLTEIKQLTGLVDLRIITEINSAES